MFLKMYEPGPYIRGIAKARTARHRYESYQLDRAECKRYVSSKTEFCAKYSFQGIGKVLHAVACGFYEYLPASSSNEPADPKNHAAHQLSLVSA